MASDGCFQCKTQSGRIALVWAVVLSSSLVACGGGPHTKTYTIGVTNYAPPLEESFDGFKAEMAELGYVEGENVTYIYDGPLPDPQAGEREVESLVAQDVDLVLTIGTQATLQAKRAVEGTDIAVIFAPVIDPVEEGVVESIRHPGGNLTGVQSGNTLPKALEWLLTLVPGASRVYVPYNPVDRVSVTSLALLSEAASTLEVELVLDEVSTPEEVMATIETLPGDDVFFALASPTLGGIDYAKIATERGIAVGSYMSGITESGGLVSYATSRFSMGKQAARLADQVFQGADPADLPVETAEFFLTINLKTAQVIGLDVPDEILEQADIIIR
jgi:putative ABC transport system substrate-binding protein